LNRSRLWFVWIAIADFADQVAKASSMDGSAVKGTMMRQLLFASSLVWGLAGQPAAGQQTPAFEGNPVALSGESWRAAVLKPLEIKVDGKNSDGEQRISVVIDRVALLHELPSLQEHGALSTSISGDDVAKHPASYANALSLLATSYAVRDLYATHPNLGATRWKVSLSPPSDGDGQAVREMFSFRFDRPRFQGVEWDRLAFTEFPKIAAGFSYNLRFTLEMSHELDGSIADD